MKVAGNLRDFDQQELEQALRMLIEDAKYFMQYLAEQECDNFECIFDDVKMTLHRDDKYLEEAALHEQKFT